MWLGARTVLRERPRSRVDLQADSPREPETRAAVQFYDAFSLADADRSENARLLEG
jgi:hypothetical protein